MSRAVSLADRLAPDTVNRLKRAAGMRYYDAIALLPIQRRLSALYLLGYSVEMCLAAAFFHTAGFASNAGIDRDTRQRTMAHVRSRRRALRVQFCSRRAAHPPAARELGTQDEIGV